MIVRPCSKVDGFSTTNVLRPGFEYEPGFQHPGFETFFLEFTVEGSGFRIVNLGFRV